MHHGMRSLVDDFSCKKRLRQRNKSRDFARGVDRGVVPAKGYDDAIVVASMNGTSRAVPAKVLRGEFS
jgi:hypothetical protein